jgi:hypothetical protein
MVIGLLIAWNLILLAMAMPVLYSLRRQPTVVAQPTADWE